MKVKIKGDSAQAIFESIRECVNQGELVANENLPSVRALAQQLNVNRNTVSFAYQKLAQAGIAETRGRLGTRIKPLPEAGEQEGGTNTPLFDLADGSPKKDWLPDLNQIAQQTHFQQYLYGESPILPELHEYTQNWFTCDGLDNFTVSVSNGAIDAIERLIAAHLVTGDQIAVEDPCYISSANAIRLAGLQVCGIPIDQDGMCVDALQSALAKGVKAVLITPRAQNPTGAALSEQRAIEIKRTLADYPDVLVMVDDHFALLASTPYYSVIPASTHHWGVFRSLSKGFGPDLRVALMVSDHGTAKRINSRLAPGMSWVSRILQAFAYTCLTSADVQQLLHNAKEDYRELRTLAIEQLALLGVDATRSKDGLNIWIPCPTESKLMAYELSKLGWLVRPGSSFVIDTQACGVRVSMQKLTPAVIQSFCAALDSALKTVTTSST